MSLRDDLGRWMFERDYRERGLATPDVAEWDEYVERNQEDWKREADAVLKFVRDHEELPAVDLAPYIAARDEAVRALAALTNLGHEWNCPQCGATTRARMADQ